MFKKYLIARARSRLDSIKTRSIAEESKQKESLVKGILEMSDMVEVYEDDACTIPATAKYLETQSLEALVNIYKEMLDEAEKMLLGRD